MLNESGGRPTLGAWKVSVTWPSPPMAVRFCGPVPANPPLVGAAVNPPKPLLVCALESASTSMPCTMLLAVGNWITIAPALTAWVVAPVRIVCAPAVAWVVVVTTTAVFWPAATAVVTSGPSVRVKAPTVTAGAAGADLEVVRLDAGPA